MVSLGQRMLQVKGLVDEGKYFTINRARQYGKTTTLHALSDYLGQDYFVVSMDFQMQMSDAKFRNENAFALAFARAFVSSSRVNEISTEPEYDNALKAFVAGGVLASTVSEYIFVMKKATSAGTLTFQKLSTTGVTMPANKAYVQVAASAFTSAHELSISFGDEDVTAINAVKDVTNADNRYYNLSGQVVANPTKGIYILNGKKVVIK